MTLPFKMSNDLRTLKAQLQAVINDYDSYDIKFNQEYSYNGNKQNPGDSVPIDELTQIRDEIDSALSKPLPATSLEDHVLYRMYTRFFLGMAIV